MNGMVVVVGAELLCTWGWAWVEWRGRESAGSGSIGVGGWVEGWMSGMECMEINCFLGDDMLMVLWILTHSSLQSAFTSLHTSPPPSSLRGFALVASSIRLLTFRASASGKLMWEWFGAPPFL